MDGAKPNSTTFPAKRRSVQRPRPSGGVLHATAITWASCFPLSFRRCPGLGCSLRACSSPSSTRRLRILPTVAVATYQGGRNRPIRVPFVCLQQDSCPGHHANGSFATPQQGPQPTRSYSANSTTYFALPCLDVLPPTLLPSRLARFLNYHQGISEPVGLTTSLSRVSGDLPNFSNSLIANSNFKDACWTRPNFREVRIAACDFTNASLKDADLSGANFSTDLSALAAQSQECGITQRQLDEARSEPNKPPILNGLLDSKTLQPLVWRGRTLEDVPRFAERYSLSGCVTRLFRQYQAKVRLSSLPC